MTRFVCFGVMSNDISDLDLHKAWSHTRSSPLTDCPNNYCKTVVVIDWFKISL